MLCNHINQTIHVFRSTKNGFFFVCSFNSIIWYNILGGIHLIVKVFSKFRK